MADRHSSPAQVQRAPRPTAAAPAATPGSAFLQKLHEHAPNSAQLLGFLSLLLSGGILLLLTGLTVTGTVIGLILFTPIIVISSPIWVPLCVAMFVTAVGLLSVCGFGITALAGLSWLYRYFRGLHPPGSDRADYARNRIFDTARHVKDYAREYGGYLHSKLKDVAPGA
ncbi:uncharacterized protein J3R85_003288 [Psidium guajava]|nr:uncharacterized protein J3R85_003288 [Psidium guajava]